MPSYQDLPTREQIAAIDDPEALEDIRDEVDLAIARIETDLSYSDRDDEWYDRARNALALHKYINTMLGRRLKVLGWQTTKAATATAPTRRRTAWSALTGAALDGELVEPATVPDELPALEAALATLKKQIDALKDDRDDEIVRFDVVHRDTVFLTKVSAALRHCGAIHQELLQRAAAVRKVAKAATQAQRDSSRPELFVDAAREILDRDTFLSIWESVDRRAPVETRAA